MKIMLYLFQVVPYSYLMQTIFEDIKFLALVIIGFVLFIAPMIAVEWQAIDRAFFSK